ncbi:hypothetical protein NA78x_005742 [Anatilimnocola sp. NA78]|uniref:hypothetical protein n=1 Tax=Anatilimnocola sp. NA78 TaxID=3415683 RepID=UPI003CE45D9E
MTNRAPLIVAVVLLLLPVLYVGSYLALVVPGGKQFVTYYRSNDPQFPLTGDVKLGRYRVAFQACSRIFWPLEQIDRKVRPGAWNVLGSGGAT